MNLLLNKQNTIINGGNFSVKVTTSYRIKTTKEKKLPQATKPLRSNIISTGNRTYCICMYPSILYIYS